MLGRMTTPVRWPTRYELLDGIRGLAALGVDVSGHWTTPALREAVRIA